MSSNFSISCKICLVLVIVVATKIISAQVPGFGACPSVNVVKNFDAQRYLGLWFEVKKYPFIFTLGGKCITADYGINSNGTLSVLHKQQRNGKEETIKGWAREVGVGILGVNFLNVPCELLCIMLFS